MNSDRNDKLKNSTETKLSGHKRIKKELKPPFSLVGSLMPCSWVDDRMPEMLWAVLVIGNVERTKALDFFRYVADHVHKNQDCYDVTLTGISKFPPNGQREFIKILLSYSDEIKMALRPLVLFPSLPAIEVWKSILGQLESKEDWQKLAAGVSKTLWHQSEEATDCRWIKLLCLIVGGKMHFNSSIEGIEDTLQGILGYPNYGDLRRIRPSIRAAEISFAVVSDWAKSFWQYCFEKTACIPKEAVIDKREKRHKEFEEAERARTYYFEEAKNIRNKLIDHLLTTAKTSAIDSRHESAFGIVFFGISLFIELIFHRLSLSITSRGNLRMLVEACIIFKYLLKKEKKEPRIWDDYRSYGSGQLKLLYLKLKESREPISSIELDELSDLANEDQWVEFITINLGHWDSTDLRTISEEVGLKSLYDRFYIYTSGHMHASWGAIRESVYQKCLNPLHRLHRVPTYGPPLISSSTIDAIEITNYILESLSETYPKFDFRLKQFDIGATAANGGKNSSEKEEE